MPLRTTLLMHCLRLCLMVPLLLVLLAVTSSAANADEFFEKKVRPLLVEKCYKCHAGAKTAGGLSLETKQGWVTGGESGPAIIPGDADSSLLIDAINYRGLEMPPKDKGGKLTSEQIAILTTWVNKGAMDPRVAGAHIGGMTKADASKWWAYQPVASTPPTENSDFIDKMIGQALKRQGLRPQKQAGRRELIRRATYDLTGLPPTYQQVVEFEQDQSPDAFLKVVNRLLESPQYGERWGRHWLDIVRYADTAGENSDRPLPHAWRYRNWVIDSLNKDIPFNAFVQQQLAGDLAPLGDSIEARNNGIIATGYLAVARRYGHDINKDIHLMHEDVIDNLGKAFLGMTLGCARCHDHKYDPVTSTDYYALYGIFNSTKFSFPGCEPIPRPADLIALALTPEAERQQQEYARAMAEYEAQRPNNPETVTRLKQLGADVVEILATANVGQSGHEIFADHLGDKQIRFIKKGEVLQLRIMRNANYGADTTGFVLKLQNVNDEQKQWSSEELVELIDSASPLISVREAGWAFLDVTDGPRFLVDKKMNIGGHAALKGWALGDNPSVFANTGSATVAAWTSLPPKTLFTHPGPNEDAAIAWICPEDGEYKISGHVLDGHPGAGDGVSFNLEHFRSVELGAELVKLGGNTSKLQPPAPIYSPVAFAVTDGTVGNVPQQLRGDPEQPGDKVPRRWLEVFGSTPLENPGQSGRRELATWVTSHPLFARVLANRVWQWHFGQGIVATPNDFGSRGSAPSHPQLLEFLASQLVAHGYQLKPLHRTIMLSKAYQLSSDPPAIGLERDPGNIWLSYFTPRRLSAEEIRDSLLLVSGELDIEPATAHPFPPESTWSFSQHNPFNAVYQTNKRSVYMMVQRQRRHPFLALFDGPDPNASSPIRGQTTVPTQALYFLNDEFFHSSANQTASHLAGAESLDQLYQLLFQRSAEVAELSIARQFLATYEGSEQEKWQALCRVLLASNEFLYLD